jgi:sulfite exporter TauE/SafE
MTALLAGLAAGLAGSLHCTVMCGPLVAAVGPRGRRALLYHAGRTLTYIALGVVAGAAGSGMASIGLARVLALAAAGLLVVQAFGGADRVLGATRHGRLTAGIVRVFAAARHRAPTGPVVSGALNGLLPCGLVYAAATAAAGLGSVRDAMLLMMAFGAGTAPVLLAGGAALGALRRRFPSGSRKLAPIGLVLLAAILVARALTTGSGHVH